MKLGERRVWKGSGAKRSCVTKGDEMMYIPILTTLQALLSNDTIYSEVCKCVVYSSINQ